MLADKFVSGYYAYDYPITVEQLREMGLKVSTDVPPEVYELMALYPQARANRPESSIYIPMVPRPITREARSEVLFP